jgi:hypothetical protein
MFEANKATFQFLRENKLVTIILIIALSLLFATSVYLHGMSRRAEIEGMIYQPYAAGTYIASFDPAAKENMDLLLKSIESMDKDIHELVIRGNSFLVNKTGGRLEIPITGYYQQVNTPVSIIRGTDKMKEGEVLINSWDFANVFGPNGYGFFYDMSDTEHLIFEKAGVRSIAGVVYYPTAISFWGVIVEYAHFYELAQDCTSLEIAFQNPLSKEEEKTFVRSLNNFVTVTSFQYPTNIRQSSMNEGNVQLGFYRCIILICVLFAMKLLSYLYYLRKSELTIIRMLGGRRTTLIAYIFSALFQIVFASTWVGLGMVFILSRWLQSIYIFQYMSLSQVANDIAFFWGMTLLIGIIQLVFAENNTIESAAEGA